MSRIEDVRERTGNDTGRTNKATLRLGDRKTLSFEGLRVIVEVVEITPQIAADWLETRIGNRPLAEAAVKNLARQIGAGRWMMNGKAILFDEDGHLTDGQHRLAACVHAGEPIISLVVRGFPRESIPMLDLRLKRTARDAMAISGHESPRLLAATARLAWLHDDGGIHRRDVKPSPAELLDYVDAHPEIHESVELGRGASWVNRPVLAFCHNLFAKQDRHLADEFAEKLSSGCGIVEGDPVGVLRARMAEMRRGRSRFDPVHTIALCFKAWNLTKAGKTTKRLDWQGEGESPEEFPAID